MEFETVRDMIAEQLKVDPAQIKPESRLMEDLKADSANIMVMIMDMEDRFGITVEDDQIMKLKTVGDVAAYIASVKAQSEDENPSFSSNGSRSWVSTSLSTLRFSWKNWAYSGGTGKDSNGKVGSFSRIMSLMASYSSTLQDCPLTPIMWPFTNPFFPHTELEAKSLNLMVGIAIGCPTITFPEK